MASINEHHEPYTMEDLAGQLIEAANTLRDLALLAKRQGEEIRRMQKRFEHLKGDVAALRVKVELRGVEVH